MSNFTDPIKVGFGRYLAGFHAQLIGDTKGVRELASREFAKSAVWAPGRMVDQVEDMLAAWRKNDTSHAAQPTPYLPIIIVAMGKDFVAAPAEFGRTGGDAQNVMIPGDPKNRVFKMRTVTADIRVQVVIAAADDPTARSIAMQLQAFTSELANRRFSAVYNLAGVDSLWPVVFELQDLLMPSLPTEQKNLTLLAADLTMRATVPMLLAPKRTEPNDGQGTGANQEDQFGDPSGYLVVQQADGKSFPADLDATNPATWTIGASV